MHKIAHLLTIAALCTITGCQNSRLRKDFVSLFSSPVHSTSPFAQKCDKAGQKVESALDESKRGVKSAESGAKKLKEDVKEEGRQIDHSVKKWWFG